MRRLFAPDSRLRVALDLVWVGAFAAAFLWLALGARGAGQLERGVALELTPGIQEQGLYRRGQRLGTVVLEVRRQPQGWQLDRRLLVDGKRAALIRQRLRADLSLASLSLDADVSALGDLAGVPRFLLHQLGTNPRLRLSGECDAETGLCRLLGAAGRFPLNLPITAGRGPVLSTAIYPLLARGSLGRKLELSLFDPLALRTHLVTFVVEERETLRLRSGTHRAVRVRCDVQGMTARVWLDERGLLLREEMPLGVVAEHESWRSL